MSQHQQVKVIGSNGQLSIGKKFAGQTVLIDQLDKGTWMIKTGHFIPESEKWLHQKDHLEKLDMALSWDSKHKPQDNFKETVKKIENEHS